MIWALWEITIPLCITFLAGIFGGWLLWRWRRRVVTAKEWDAATTGNAANEIVADNSKELQNALDSLSKEQAEVAKLKKTLDIEAKASASAKDQIVKLNTQLIQSAQEKDQFKHEINTLKPMIENNDSELRKATVELTNANKELTSKCNELTAKANTLDKSNSDLNDSLDRAKEDNKELTDHIVELKQSNNALTGKNTALEQTVSTLNQSNSELARIKGQLNESKLALDTASNDKRKAQTELSEIQKKFKQFEGSTIAARNEQANEKQKLQDRLAALQSEQNKQSSDAKQSAAEVTQLRQNNAQLQTELMNAKRSQQSGEAAQRDVANLRAQLEAERKQSAALKSQVAAQKPASVTPIDQGKIKKLKEDIDTRDERIKQLEKKLAKRAKKSNTKKTNPKKTTPKKTNKGSSWQKGKTKLGTPGSDHKDDLKKIVGIGPKLEGVLNRLGVKSWEQLAAFNAAEVKMVDEALTEFPGRITRDKWVPQAKAIMRNGHQPLNGKPKAKSTQTKKKKKAGKPAKIKSKSWKSGKTKFGTPGSSHKDDLKVVNGIGPVIEKSLNRRGIKAWEQLATLTAKDVKVIDEALDFPGRIAREQWVKQAKSLVKRFPDHSNRPNRKTLLNAPALRKSANG